MAVNPERRAGELAAIAAAEGSTVLVVDDDPSVVLLLRVLFEENGFRVLAAGSGGEAIRTHMLHGPLDLIVTDIDMPGMDGLRMCRLLEGCGSTTPVIVVSGLDIPAARVHDSAASVAGFLRKPFAVADLLDMAVAAMGLARPEGRRPA